MNPRAGWALIKSTWLSWMQYRSFFFVLAFGWMVPPLVSLFAWMAAAGDGRLGGMGRAEFAGYYLLLVLANQITYSQTNWTLGDIIRSGGLNAWLVRPLPAIYQVLSSEIAGKVVYMVFVIPMSLLLALLLQPHVEASFMQVLLFIPALLMAWALRFLWGFWLASLAFWASRSDSLLALQDSLVFLLSGIVAPVAMLPPFLQAVAKVLPFRYMVGFPVEILTQPMSATDTLTGFALQAAWLSVASLLAVLLWKTGVRRYAAIGG